MTTETYCFGSGSVLFNDLFKLLWVIKLNVGIFEWFTPVAFIHVPLCNIAEGTDRNCAGIDDRSLYNYVRCYTWDSCSLRDGVKATGTFSHRSFFVLFVLSLAARQSEYYVVDTYTLNPILNFLYRLFSTCY